MPQGMPISGFGVHEWKPQDYQDQDMWRKPRRQGLLEKNLHWREGYQKNLTAIEIGIF
jgi:hypothetical protein